MSTSHKIACFAILIVASALAYAAVFIASHDATAGTLAGLSLLIFGLFVQCSLKLIVNVNIIKTKQE